MNYTPKDRLELVEATREQLRKGTADSKIVSVLAEYLRKEYQVPDYADEAAAILTGAISAEKRAAEAEPSPSAVQEESEAIVPSGSGGADSEAPNDATEGDKFPDVALAFPQELKDLNRWIVRTADKRPCSAYEENESLGPIDPHDEQYQADYNTAMGALDQTTLFAGAGFVFNYADGYTGTDFDDCVNPDTMEIRSDVLEIIKKVDSYTEFSPSRSGVHIFTKGWQFPIGPEGQQGAKVGKAEMYSGKRYFTVTGNHVPGTPLTVNDRDLDWLYEPIVTNREFFEAKKKADGTSASSGDSSCVVTLKKPGVILQKYNTLMNGTILRSKDTTGSSDFAIEDDAVILEYESQSSADYALLRLIADKLNTDDATAIKEEFLKSPLGQRPKATRGDYLERSITKLLREPRPKPVNPVIVEPAVPQPKIDIVDEFSPAAIPPFDPSVITGIFVDFVELLTRGTTLAPQFPFLAAKVVVGALMAGRVKFENLDVEPRYYGALLGETGSGKGEAWRRMMQILHAEGLGGGTSGGCGIKIINSADSGAGLKEFFFDPPEHQPVICYVDEIEGLGNKANEKRNPAILDTMIELADSTSISRLLAKKRKTKDDARLSMFMCGQDGDVYMKAFAGRTKLGMYDRLYPEYGVPVEAGDLPPIDTMDAYKMLGKLCALDYSVGVMTMNQAAKDVFNDFWLAQPKEVRTKARWKKNILVDAYVAAFGRGSKQVELEDMNIAVKMFTRQLVIRKVCFRSEVPDKVGFYLGKCKDLTERMRRELQAGVPFDQVALSRRDYETKTNAYKNNEEHFFEKAWQTHSRVHLLEVDIQKANGRVYKKFLPLDYD